MFPWVTGFHWTAGTLIFLGLFYAVISIVVGMTVVTFLKARRDLRTPVDALRWELEFEDLPEKARACRHELTGEVKHRVCHNGFDCGTCRRHPDLEARRLENCGTGRPPADNRPAGLEMPADRLYHRGHTWARPEPDGTMTIGLDDLGRRLLGRVVDRLELPAIGTRLRHSAPAWKARRGDVSARFLAPVDGEVVAVGRPEDDWILQLRPPAGGFNTTHLLKGREISPWILRELERLEMALVPDGSGGMLADGGAPVPDLPKSVPGADWDRVYGEMFLEP